MFVLTLKSGQSSLRSRRARSATFASIALWVVDLVISARVLTPVSNAGKASRGTGTTELIQLFAGRRPSSSGD